MANTTDEHVDMRLLFKQKKEHVLLAPDISRHLVHFAAMIEASASIHIFFSDWTVVLSPLYLEEQFFPR